MDKTSVQSTRDKRRAQRTTERAKAQTQRAAARARLEVKRRGHQAEARHLARERRRQIELRQRPDVEHPDEVDPRVERLMLTYWLYGDVDEEGRAAGEKLRALGVDVSDTAMRMWYRSRHLRPPSNGV